MKTLTILFESPNVFYAVIDGVNIRIENYQLLPIIIGHNGFDSFKTKTQEVLKSGDIFQVEGFEYEVKKEHCAYPDTCYERHCNKFCSEKVAILKLAKEEEQEPDIQTSDIHHTFKPHGQFKVKEEEPKESIVISKMITEIDEERKRGYNQAIDDSISEIIQLSSKFYDARTMDRVVEQIQKLKK